MGSRTPRVIAGQLIKIFYWLETMSEQSSLVDTPQHSLPYGPSHGPNINKQEKKKQENSIVPEKWIHSVLRSTRKRCFVLPPYSSHSSPGTPWALHTLMYVQRTCVPLPLHLLQQAASVEVPQHHGPLSLALAGNVTLLPAPRSHCLLPLCKLTIGRKVGLLIHHVLIHGHSQGLSKTLILIPVLPLPSLRSVHFSWIF